MELAKHGSMSIANIKRYAMRDIKLKPMAQQTAETIEALEEFKMIVNKLSYIVNNVGINDSFDRTMARNTIDEVEIAFNTYIKTLIK